MGRLIFTLVMLLQIGAAAARPMDTLAAKELPRLQERVTRVQNGGTLNKAEIADLTAKLQADEPVLVALAAWTLSNGNAPREETVKQLEKIEPSNYGVAGAFIKLAIARLKENDPAKLNGRLKELGASDNPYLQVEAAKELAMADPAAAKAILEKAIANRTNPARNEARRALQILNPGSTPAPPDPEIEDPYIFVLSVLNRPDLLTSHTLTGETPDGHATPPFRASLNNLRFAWQLSPGASSDPVEVRWIAADVAGVEKNHVIASNKSEPDKNEGEFTLKKPTAGFPSGQYRVEIWQVGKMIYSEKFEIKGD